MPRAFKGGSRLLHCASLLLLLTQLCTAFLDGNEVTPGTMTTPILAPEVLKALADTTQWQAGHGLSGFGANVSQDAGNYTLTVTPSATAVLVGSEVTLDAQLVGPLTTPNEVIMLIRYYPTATDDAIPLRSQNFGNATSPVQLQGTYPASQEAVATSGAVKFEAVATGTIVDQGTTSSLYVTSSNVTVTFAAPVTMLSTTTSNPKVGDTTAITATVVAAAGEDGADVSVEGATVMFTVTVEGRSNDPVVATTGADGKALFMYTWPTVSTFTVTATTLAPNMQPGSGFSADNTLTFTVSPRGRPTLTASPIQQLVGSYVSLTAEFPLSNLPNRGTSSFHYAMDNGGPSGDLFVESFFTSLETFSILKEYRQTEPGTTLLSAKLTVEEPQPSYTDTTPDVPVTFVAPTTTLLPLTVSPKVGDTTDITARVSATINEGTGEFNLGVQGAKVTFIVTAPNGKSIPYGDNNPTDANGETVFSYTWPSSGTFTVTAATLPPGMTSDEGSFPAQGPLVFKVAPRARPTLTASRSLQLVGSTIELRAELSDTPDPPYTGTFSIELKDANGGYSAVQSWQLKDAAPPVSRSHFYSTEQAGDVLFRSAVGYTVGDLPVDFADSSEDITVRFVPPTTSLQITPSSSNVQVGDTTTIAAVVVAATGAEGATESVAGATVTFTLTMHSGGSETVVQTTNAEGRAAFSKQWSAVGVYTVTATTKPRDFSGSGFASSDSPTFTVQAVGGPLTVTLEANPSVQLVGSPVQVTAVAQGRKLSTPNHYSFTVNNVNDHTEIASLIGTDGSTPLTLTGPFNSRQEGTQTIQATLALQEGTVESSVKSPVAEVRFVPPVTTLAATTSTPKVGDTTAITATVVAATGEGGKNKPVKDAAVTFTVTTSGGRSLVTSVIKTGPDGTAVFNYLWLTTGAFTIRAETLPPGLTPAGQVTPFPAEGSGLEFITGQAASPTLTANPTEQLVGSSITLTARLADLPTLPNKGTLTISPIGGGTSIGQPTTFENSASIEATQSYSQQQPGQLQFGATVTYETPPELTAASSGVTVTFVAPYTTLSAPTLSPTVGQATTITATVTKADAGGAAVNGAVVSFTIAPTTGRATTIIRPTGPNGKATLDFTWPSSGRYTVTATTIPQGVDESNAFPAANTLQFTASDPQPPPAVDFTKIILTAARKPYNDGWLWPVARQLSDEGQVLSDDDDVDGREKAREMHGGRKMPASKPHPILLTATVLKADGTNVPGVTVAFNFVHPCKHKHSKCTTVSTAVSDAMGQAKVVYRDHYRSHAYVTAEARNSAGDLVSSARASLWLPDQFEPRYGRV